jgi:hypothetical protein
MSFATHAAIIRLAARFSASGVERRLEFIGAGADAIKAPTL